MESPDVAWSRQVMILKKTRQKNYDESPRKKSQSQDFLSVIKIIIIIIIINFINVS